MLLVQIPFSSFSLFLCLLPCAQLCSMCITFFNHVCITTCHAAKVPMCSCTYVCLHLWLLLNVHCFLFQLGMSMYIFIRHCNKNCWKSLLYQGIFAQILRMFRAVFSQPMRILLMHLCFLGFWTVQNVGSVWCASLLHLWWCSIWTPGM